ncbi:unnamed protein product, partial [Adineta ricciae]
TMKINAVVQHTGDVLYVPPGIFKAICSFNIASFPFDTQQCTLKFGSWTFDDAGINLTAESNQGQLDAFIKNGQWDLEEFSAVISVLKYECCPTLYPFVLYTIRIRRFSLYYFFNIVVPCFLISCMTILGFLLAPDSGEKLTLQITILLSVIMFSLLMFEIMPPSSTAVPIITKYFTCIMIMSTVSVAASVLVISIHFRNAHNHTMPLWIQKYICYYTAWLLLMKHPRYDLTWRGIRQRWNMRKGELNGDGESVTKYRYKCRSTPLVNNLFEFLPSKSLPSHHHSHDSAKTLNAYQTDWIRSELRIIASHLAILSRRVQREEKYNEDSEDWKFVAMVIDRLCLTCFTLSMIVFTGWTLLSVPSMFKRG